MEKQRILFIDRDGTLIEEPDDEQIDSFEKLHFVPGVFSNLDDMITFVKMLSLGGDGYLSPATLEAALHNRTPNSKGEFRGLGFNLAGSPKSFLGDLMSPQAYGHTGFTGTSIAIDPTTKLWVVLLTNRVCPSRNNLKLIRLRSLVHNAAAAEASRLTSKQQQNRSCILQLLFFIPIPKPFGQRPTGRYVQPP